jgi:hypothetical protein
MPVNLNNDGTLSITAMSLVEFLPEIETAVHNGFMLNLEKNEGVPQQFGSMLVLTMYPTDGVVQVEGESKESLKAPVKEEAPKEIPKVVAPPVLEKAPEVALPKALAPEVASPLTLQRGRPKAK